MSDNLVTIDVARDDLLAAVAKALTVSLMTLGAPASVTDDLIRKAVLFKIIRGESALIAATEIGVGK